MDEPKRESKILERLGIPIEPYDDLSALLSQLRERRRWLKDWHTKAHQEACGLPEDVREHGTRLVGAALDFACSDLFFDVWERSIHGLVDSIEDLMQWCRIIYELLGLLPEAYYKASYCLNGKRRAAVDLIRLAQILSDRGEARFKNSPVALSFLATFRVLPETTPPDALFARSLAAAEGFKAYGPVISCICWRHMRELGECWPVEPAPETVDDSARIRRVLDTTMAWCSSKNRTAGVERGHDADEPQDLQQTQAASVAVAATTMPTESSGSEGREGQHKPTEGLRPGYLNLIVDFNKRTVGRQGTEAVVELAKKEVLWHIFVVLYHHKGKRVDRDDLKSGYPGDFNRSALNNAIHRLRTELKRLDVTVDDLRLVGVPPIRCGD